MLPFNEELLVVPGNRTQYTFDIEFIERVIQAWKSRGDKSFKTRDLLQVLINHGYEIDSRKGASKALSGYLNKLGYEYDTIQNYRVWKL